jgi:hypothetical protein
MIAISVLFAWLALGAAAFLTLSALGRVAARRDLEAQLGLLGNNTGRPASRVEHARVVEITPWHPARRLLDTGIDLLDTHIELSRASSLS